MISQAMKYLLLLFCAYFLFCNAVLQAQMVIVDSENRQRASSIVFNPVTTYRGDSLEIKKLLARSIRYQWTHPDSAMMVLNLAFSKSILSDNFDDAATAKINMGLVAMGQGNFDASYQFYREAYFYIRKSKRERQLMTALFVDIGATYMYQGNYEKAFQYYYLILQYMLKVNYSNNNLVMTYNNIADVLIQMEQYDKAAYYLAKGESLIYKRNSESIYSYILVNKSDIARVKGDFKAADAYSDKALVFARKYKNPEVEQAIYIAKGRSALGQRNTEMAIYYLNRALNTNVTTYPYYSMIGPHYLLGLTYYEAGDYAKAEQSLLMALEKARRTGIIADKIKALKTLSSVYEKLGKYKESLQFQHEHDQLRDSILNQERMERANHLEISYRTAEKDKELAQKELLIEKQHRDLDKKNIFIAAIVSGFIIVIILSVVLYRYFKSKNKITALNAKIEGEEKERSRIAKELHDGIGGMLAVVKMKMSLEKEDEIKEDIMTLLNETSEEVRKTAHNLMPDIVQNSGLKEALTLYAETVNHSSNDLQIDLQLRSELNIPEPSRKLSIYRMFQEVIQNIIKHAKATNAIIQIFDEGSRIHMLIEDNGIGFDPETTEKGLGIKNLEARVKALQGDISIESTIGEGTTIHIEFEK